MTIPESADVARHNSAARAQGRTLASLLAVSLIAACADAPAVEETVELGPADAVLDDPDRQFTWLTGVRELSDGRIIAVDFRENRLEVLDATLQSGEPIGRAGDGPGEYRQVGWVYPLGADSSLVTDPNSRAWYMLDGTRIVERITAESPTNRIFDPIMFGSAPSGHLLGTAGHVWTNPAGILKTEADSLVLLLGRIGSENLDTVTVLKGQARQRTPVVRRAGEAPPQLPPQHPFVTEDLGLLFPDGWIAVARVEPYRVEWRAPDGTWVHGAPLPFTPVPIDDAEKCAAVQPVSATPQPCDPLRIEAPDALPPFLPMAGPAMIAPATPTLHPLPDGRLLIRRTPSAAAPGNRYDIVDREGGLAGRLELPANEAVIGFGADAVYVVAMDAMGLQVLRRHPWP